MFLLLLFLGSGADFTVVGGGSSSGSELLSKVGNDIGTVVVVALMLLRRCSSKLVSIGWSEHFIKNGQGGCRS